MASIFCCRTLRPETPPLSLEGNLNELSHDGPGNDRDIPTLVLDQISPSTFDARDALNTIFGTSSSVQVYREVKQSSLTSSQDTVHLRRVNKKGSGTKLEVVSSKIRKHFSRESRLKESSRTKGETTDGVSDGAAIQLDDILDDLSASQGGYDSDAENIATPQTVHESMSGQVQVPPEYLTRLLRQIKTSQDAPMLEDRSKHKKLRIRRPSKPADVQVVPGLEEVNGNGSQQLDPISPISVDEVEAGGNPGPSTPKTKRGDSVVRVWEFRKDESPKDLMRRISAAMSEHSPNFPLESEIPRGRLSIRPDLQTRNWSPSFSIAAPRRRSSARPSAGRGQDASPDHAVVANTGSNQVTSSDWIGGTQGVQNESQPLLEKAAAPLSTEKGGRAEDVVDILPTKPPVNKLLPDTSRTGNYRIINCICDLVDDHGNIVLCEGCHTWQHVVCYYHDEEVRPHHRCSKCEPRAQEIENAIKQQMPSKELDGSHGNDQKESHTRKLSTGESEREGKEKSVHLFDMKISQRLGSGSLLLSGNNSTRVHSRRQSSQNSMGVNPYHVRRVSGASSTGIMHANPRPEWLTPRRDNASSFYASQPGSLPSSGGSSLLHIPHLLDEWAKEVTDDRRKSLDRRVFDHTLLYVPGEGDWMRCNTVDTIRSSADSFRARELVNAEVRFPTRRISEPKGSRFTEDFGSLVHDGDMRRRSKSELLTKRDHQGSGVSRSTSDGWLSGGRRQGHGFELVPQTQIPSHIPEDDAALLWERALKFHAESAASSLSGSHAYRHGTKPRSSLVRQPRARKSMHIVSPSVSSELRSSGEAAFSNTLAAQDFWVSPAGLAVVSGRGKKLGYFSNRSFPSWSRFPSHSRSARTEHAGTDDNVIARDFSPPQAVVPQGSPSDLGRRGKRHQKKKTRSMTFGKRNVFSKTYWQRLYRSHSSDVRRFQTGHRSSVSVGGKLEYPELEIIPGGELPYLVHEVREMKRESGRLENEIGHGEVLLDREGSSWSWEDEGDKYRGQRKRTDLVEKPSAKMWSKLYEECVDVAGRFGKDGAMSGVCSHDNEGEEDEGMEEEFHDAPESSNMLAADGRSATVEHEVSAHGSVVVMPERAKTELGSEMGDCLRQLLEDEEREKAEVIRKAEDVLRAEDVYAM